MNSQAPRPAGTRPAANPSPPPPAGGFSLIELLGVMVIIAVLAAAMAPILMKQFDAAAATKERADLAAMAAALRSSILRSRTVPSDATWMTAVSGETAMSLNVITNTPRGYARAFLIDTSGWLGTVSLPYTQGTNGTSRPLNARMMIVSTLAKALPIASGKPATGTFNDLWNTPQGAKPSTSIWTTWPGNGRDLVIQRINLDPLFHRVILNSGDVGGTGHFSIDASATVNLPAGAAGWNAYYLDGSGLSLYDTNSTTVPVVREIVNADLSRVFEYGVWRDGTLLGLRTNNAAAAGASIAARMAPIATQFLSAKPPSSARWGATPTQVTSMLYAYMFGYSSYANQSPCFGNAGGSFLGLSSQWFFLNSILWFNQSGNLIGQ